MSDVSRFTRKEIKMADVKSIGILETNGFTPLITGADAALKAANVDLVEWRQVGSSMVSFVIEGEVAAVRSAIEAARSAAQSAGEVMADMVIPRPVDELQTTFNK
ncbi:BMC domain-containing protein [candidate division KSB1 bacterium]|nr:BMC domain-containing protein [candidate division KSB1 bacterium]